MTKITAVILTFNEERNISRCIDSIISLVDEIVIVDSFSTDRTPEICKSYGVIFHQHPFEGYIEQKNYAMKLASNDMILSLDADEALSDELVASIQKVKLNREYDGYTMNRLTNYCGKWIHHSGWYPDRKLRLVDKRKGIWGGTNPHDKFEMTANGRVFHLSGDIHHYSYYTFEEHRSQVIRFAEISAMALHEKGIRSNILKIIYKPIARFLRAFVMKAGFLDGWEGWTIARMTAWASYLRYLKLYRIQQ